MTVIFHLSAMFPFWKPDEWGHTECNRWQSKLWRKATLYNDNCSFTWINTEGCTRGSDTNAQIEWEPPLWVHSCAVHVWPVGNLYSLRQQMTSVALLLLQNIIFSPSVLRRVKPLVQRKGEKVWHNWLPLLFSPFCCYGWHILSTGAIPTLSQLVYPPSQL